MRQETHYSPVALIVFLMICWLPCFGQPNTTIELNKPEKYQNRLLPAEKTGNKKFTIPKRLYNNTVSQFNYYFNANNKLNDIINAAKEINKDDYTKLLSFYNYSLTETAKGQIDSVIYKCTAGILLHDLRNDWVDRFYLLMGNAYLHRQNYDSAYEVFQYINYAFAPKEDGYDIPIGSNASNNSGAFSVSSSEKRNIWKKMSSAPPARNESFLLQVRNFIEQQKTAEAEALLEVIRADRSFPERLKNNWYEMEAYLNYVEEHYDTAAYFIIKALPLATNKMELARKEYLAAQLLERANKDSAAINLFEKAINHTTDPLMEVYARLNIVSLSAEKKPDALQQNLNQLLAMAKRDKYQSYRDLIYYAAAELELKRKNTAAAEQLLMKSIAMSEDNNIQKNRSFLLLGDVSYLRKKYIPSASFYDSINTSLLKQAEQQKVVYRQPYYRLLATNFIKVQREDSLHRIAAMPVDERNAYIKSVVKKLRKEKGIKDNDSSINYGSSLTIAAPTDIFAVASTDFYFINSNLKTKGLSSFKAKWGNRPNIDNWRRQSAVDRSFSTATSDTDPFSVTADTKAVTEKEISVESLLNDLPLTPLKLEESNKTIIDAYLKNGYTFQYNLNDVPAAINIYEELLNRFPEHPAQEEAWYELSNCYRKIGEPAKADTMKQLLNAFYPKGKFNNTLRDKNNTQQQIVVQKTYENVYNAFVEGRFETAKEEKIKADKQFGKSYWTPQLLYIEAIYYIKQKQDSTAINRLQQIALNFPKTTMAEKAQNMIGVLNRRTEIEKYLTDLSVNIPVENIARNIDLNSTNATQVPVLKKDSTSIKIPQQLTNIPLPAEAKNAIIPVAPETYQFNAADTQYVVVMLQKVDPIFISEGRNAFNRYNQERYYGQKITTTTAPINDSVQLLLIGPFSNAGAASDYIDKTKPMVNSRIIPWLTPDKYSFSIISPANLFLLRKKKDAGAYKNFLNQLFPDKF